MLLAVEGGGFFSSSASGYSKGLALLLLGDKKEEKSMRVSPWNHYQLVDQQPKPDPHLQLDSCKNNLVRGCASFVCFGRATAGIDTSCPLKAVPTETQDVLPSPPPISEYIPPNDLVENENSETNICLKSSLKKPTTIIPVTGRIGNEREAKCGNEMSVPYQEERRKVQWTDVSGGELFDIREFEPSEKDRSEDEYDNGNQRTCLCTIM